jgi:hypothetical protein
MTGRFFIKTGKMTGDVAERGELPTLCSLISPFSSISEVRRKLFSMLAT